MQNQPPVKGFSKLSRDEKIHWLSASLQDDQVAVFLQQFRLKDENLQGKFESFSENTLTNYHLPWGMVPNVMVDDVLYHVPVVIEESSVVAAASKAASFWSKLGGFKTALVSAIKKGQLHFLYRGNAQKLYARWDDVSADLKTSVNHLTQNMEARGGGILSLKLKQVSGLADYYFQIDMEADTGDSMGANFINSVLEEMGRVLPSLITKHVDEGETDIIMAILSNHTPGSLVRISAQAAVDQLKWSKEMPPEKFASRMQWAADIAWFDPSRAVTHNKGIYNGVDAVVLATGNDFRAVEAAGHAHATRDGQYRSLSRITLSQNVFNIELEIPLALGTVGGLTKLHPLAAKTLEILGNPNAKTLMSIAAAVGLANNFAAMASLVTTGIQKGHMKMHLQNILHSLNVDPRLHQKAEQHFRDKTVSVAAVREFFKKT